MLRTLQTSVPSVSSVSLRVLRATPLLRSIPTSPFHLLPACLDPTMAVMPENAKARKEIRSGTVRHVQLGVGAASMFLLGMASLCPQESAMAGEDPNNLIISVLNTMPVGGGY